MSLNELRYFYLLEWSPIITDIREQFPLWPPEETRAIAYALGFAHLEAAKNRVEVLGESLGRAE